ncbi:MAG: dihydrolipoyl dehydrogenase [Acidobacteria bacterium]|nr:dihydrolipoyl dehydrogenase [Acidobacteriota bacterium]
MDYDVLILGSGPGGYVAAIRAGQYGLKVGCIEKDPKLGGTCLHVGCIPTKAYLHYADVYEHFKTSASIGINHGGVTLDMGKMREEKQKIVDKHAGGIGMLFKKNKVDHIPGYGKLLGGGKIEVDGPGGKKVLSAKNIIVASGSRARMLPGLEPDPEKILTNIEILDMAKVPASLAVIGAGAVGMEFASVYNTFGSDVTVFEMLPKVLPPEDDDVSKEIKKIFEKKGVKIHVDTKVDKIEKTKKGVKLTYQGPDGKPQKLEVEKLLVAVGRAPNTENIGLENTKIVAERGFIKTDGLMRTTEPNMYAIGDIVLGAPQLAHTASMEGLIAVAHIAGKNPEPINYLLNPNATYCEPQVASVGLTEKKAREAGYDVKIGKFPFAGNSKATILGSHGGFIKVVTDAKYGEILGVHMIGPLVTELIAEAVAAMQAEATVETMTQAIHAHPTLPEAMQDAFNAVSGLQING